MSARASGEEASESQPEEPVADGLPLFQESIEPVQDTQEPDLLMDLMNQLEEQLPNNCLSILFRQLPTLRSQVRPGTGLSWSKVLHPSLLQKQMSNQRLMVRGHQWQ